MNPFLSPCTAVAIGASAGGVEALMSLLRRLPADFPAAVMIVLHIPSSMDSSLATLFGRACALPVSEAEDKEAIEPGRVYVAGSGYHLQVEPDRSFSLSLDEPVNFARPSIDLLFESAAPTYGSELLAIVLTGANDDGARGLRIVKSAGGRCWVQDPATATARAMPEAALATGCVDAVLDLDSMGARLAAMGRDGRDGQREGDKGDR